MRRGAFLGLEGASYDILRYEECWKIKGNYSLLQSDFGSTDEDNGYDKKLPPCTPPPSSTGFLYIPHENNTDPRKIWSFPGD
jgi:hypothetical protein